MPSKRSLLQSGGNNGGLSDKHSPKIMATNNSNKKTSAGTAMGKTENGEDIKLPKLDPTKNSIAQHQNMAKPQQ